MTSGLGGSTSMYGSFDFDAEYQVQASQRQRQTRRREDVGAEKKPTVVSLSTEKFAGKITKLDIFSKSSVFLGQQ